MMLATKSQPRHNALASLNSEARFGDRNHKADSRHAAIFTSVQNTIGASSMAGRGGDTFGYAGSLMAGSPTPLRACHPRLATGGRSTRPHKEAHHA